MRVAISTPVRTAPVAPVAGQAALAVVPVRLDLAAQAPALGADVHAEPPAGVRANVMRTSNPAVTVVWLYQ
jgi:hypothetical protein